MSEYIDLLIAGNDLVRVTGYMIRLSDVENHRAGRESRTNTTALGAEAAALTDILKRRPRVVAAEMLAGPLAAKEAAADG